MNENISLNLTGQIPSINMGVIVAKGEKGDTGNGIVSIELLSTSENGLENTYRITFTDTTTFDYIVKDGNGIVDITFISISEDGLQKTYQINFQDSTSFQFVINQGVGIKTIEKTSTLGLVDTYTITFANNSTTTFDVKNGNGIESIAKTNTNVLVDTYTITFTDTTTTTFDVTNAKSITNIELVGSDLLTDTYRINFNDNTNITFEVANGRGINNVSYISTNGLVDTYRITYNDNTTSDFIVTNGAKGDDSFSPYIDPITKTWWVYNDTTKEYEDTGTATKSVDIYNITDEIPLPVGSYYTLATAIAAIPTNIIKLCLKITFQISATNTETWEFFNGTIGNITNVAYWRKTANSTDLDLKIDKSSITDQLGASTTKVMSQKGVTDILYDTKQFLAYGVRLDLGGAGKPLERVGNLSLHKTRPISSNARNCVKNIQGVNYYLSSASDYYKEDGITPSVLDGTDGDVMKEIPEFYVLEETVNNYAYTWLSEFPLQGFKRIPRTYHGLYEGSYNTTTNQTRSVINPAANYRLGLPSTGSTRLYYNNGAKQNRNTTWSIDRILSNYVRELLFRVDYASYDCQAAYNSQLTAEGYLQGGLGAGVTTLDGRWEFNGYNPFIPCGYTAELGNRTGVKNFTMPYAYEAQNTTTHVNWYKGIYNASTIYNIGEYVADKEDTSIGLGDGKLYKCIQQTTAGIPLTNITYFTLQTRTVVQANRYLVEVPFGHTYKHTIDALIELSENYTVAKCYIYDNPEHFADTKTANARFLCNMPAIDGYIKTFNKYTTIPSSIGGSSASWGYDYFYIKNDGAGILRGVLVGGVAHYGAYAGFGFSALFVSPSIADASVGVRLCNFPEGSNIE